MTNHVLHTQWNYNWDCLENMLPYEREIIINLIVSKIEQEQKQQAQAQAAPIQHPNRWDKQHGTA